MKGTFEQINVIEEYMSLLADLKAKTDNEATALILLQEIGKDRRTHRMNSKAELDQDATPKQIAFLEKLEVEHDSGISKREASGLISEALKND